MTDNKRFTLEEFGLNFIINDNGRNLTAKQTVDKLNELLEEKEQLNSYCAVIEKDLSNCADERIRLQCTNHRGRIQRNNPFIIHYTKSN